MKKYIFLLVLAAFFASVLIAGKLLDMEAERVVTQLYERDSSGIILGLGEKHYENNHAKAVVLIHGFLENSEVYDDYLKKLTDLDQLDVYVPLLPFHGRDLQTAANFSNQKIADFLADYLGKIASAHTTVTVVGVSYGGAQLLSLDKEERLPDNTRLVLYAPAVYIISNTSMGKLKVYAYSLFRNYCNYAALGCAYPVLDSGDDTAREFLIYETNLRYKVISAVKELFIQDDQVRDHLAEIKHPFHLIIAKDDNRVSYPDQNRICQQNSFCSALVYESGRHVIHAGRHKDDLLQKIIGIASK